MESEDSERHVSIGILHLIVLSQSMDRSHQLDLHSSQSVFGKHTCPTHVTDGSKLAGPTRSLKFQASFQLSNDEVLKIKLNLL